MRSILLTLAVVLACIGAVKVEYDKFDDRTTVSTPFIDVELRDGRAHMVASLQFVGKASSGNPQLTMLSVACVSEQQRFRDGSTAGVKLVILADDQRVEMVSKRYEHELHRDKSHERFFFVPSVANLQAIGSAKRVEAKIGIDTFELSPAQIAELRDLAARITPPATQPTK